MSDCDPNRYVVRGVDDFLQRLDRLHENAAVAWDRDRVHELDGLITVSDPIEIEEIRSVGVLGYAVDDGRRIFRLMRLEVDPLGVRWIEFDRQVTMYRCLHARGVI